MSDKLNCNRCGNPLEGYSITVYNADMTVKEVICGSCDALERKETYERTGRLSGKLLVNLVLGVYDADPSFKQRVQADDASINFAIRSFEDAVWYRGLQKYVQQAKYKGHSMKTPTVKATLYAMAGRVMITLRDLNDTLDITVITAEDEKKKGVMGLQSVDATKDEAVNLLNQFIQFVQAQGLQFQVDNDVNII